MRDELQFSNVRKKIIQYDGPESKEQDEYTEVEIIPFGQIPRETRILTTPPNVGEKGIVVNILADITDLNVRQDNAAAFILQQGQWTRMPNFFDIANVGLLVNPEAFDEEMREIGAKHQILNSDTESVEGEVVGQQILNTISKKMGTGAGGLEPFVVDSLLSSAIQYYNLDQDTVDKKNKIHLLSDARQDLNDAEKLISIQSEAGIIDAINAISPSDRNGIYVASFPTGVNHQISLIFDNRNKTIYMTNSIEGAGDALLFKEKDLLDSSIAIKSGRSFVEATVFAKSSPNGISCGVCTYLNTLNIASKLCQGTVLGLKNDRKMVISLMIMDCIQPPEDRKFIDPIKMNEAVEAYYAYENASGEKQKLSIVADQALKVLGNQIDKTKAAGVESAEDDAIIQFKKIPEKQFSYTHTESVVMYKPHQEESLEHKIEEEKEHVSHIPGPSPKVGGSND